MGFLSGSWEFLRFTLDVVVVAFIIYHLIQLFRGTRAFQAFIWLVVVGALYTFSNDRFLGLTAVNWFLSNFIGSLVILVIILFQEDIRRAMGRLYWMPSWLKGTHETTTGESVEEIVAAAKALSTRSIGALMVIERSADLSTFERGAISMDSSINRHILFMLFVPSYENPTHDGAVIIRKNRIVAAHCILPLTENRSVNLGTRHRAALGLSEQTDAVMVVVSEETGMISVAMNGQIERGVPADRLRELLLTETAAKSREPVPPVRKTGSEAAND